MRILLLNGPNLNLLGTRRPDVYGSTTLPELVTQVRAWAAELDLTRVEDFQSNHEGQLIDRLHAARGQVDGIVFNPGAYTHTSYALHDAIEAIEVPTVEVHISNVDEREDWRRTSAVGPACVHTVYGRGIDGYRWALRHLVNRAAWPADRLSYGIGPGRTVDLRVPDPDGPHGSGPHPVVVLVHGGFWRRHWTTDTVESIAIDLARRGVASAVPEYPRVGRGHAEWTSAAHRVAMSVQTVLGHPAIDRDRWAIAGHSAGGQLAIAALDGLQQPFGGATAPVRHDPERSPDVGGWTVPPPRLVVSMGGVLDLVRGVEDDLGGGAVAAFVAAMADPRRQSPMHRLPAAAPLLVAHGRRDDQVPATYSQAYADAARRSGDEVELAITDDGHYEYLEPDEPAWRGVAERLVVALQR